MIWGTLSQWSKNQLKTHYFQSYETQANVFPCSNNVFIISWYIIRVLVIFSVYRTRILKGTLNVTVNGWTNCLPNKGPKQMPIKTILRFSLPLKLNRLCH